MSTEERYEGPAEPWDTTPMQPAPESQSGGPTEPASGYGNTQVQPAYGSPDAPQQAALTEDRFDRTQAGVAASDDDRLMSALAWLGLVILQIPLVSFVLLIAEGNKNRPFQKYHAVTSILFWVASFLYEILAVIVYVVLTTVTLGCLGLFAWILFFVPHIAGLYYAYQAYQGKKPEIPVISELGRNQGWA